MKLLCLSNGHGEDVIAVQILRQLQQLPNSPELAALPLVGEGYAYQKLGNVPIIGPVQPMPSGGFIYMDSRQLWQDLQGGLFQLIIAQYKAIRAWAKTPGQKAILAVGDIVPLLFAWLSGIPYGFVGTAKSEYYLRDEQGPLSSLSGMQRWQGWSGSVYLPWERWLMSRRRCKAVFPRDGLTTQILKRWSIPAYNLGNPMMDNLEPDYPVVVVYGSDMEAREMRRPLVITLLPGSRAPEAYANWQVIMEAVGGIVERFRERSILFLGAIAPSLSLEALAQILQSFGWHQVEKAGGGESIVRTLIASGLGETLDFNLQPSELMFHYKKATMILTNQAFNACLHQGDLAIAMAGTATEQFIGLGKPAIAIPGQGPQFTPAFAEAQSRLLGPSLMLVKQPTDVVGVLLGLLRDPDRLQLIAANGKRRMGASGAALRIASRFIQQIKEFED